MTSPSTPYLRLDETRIRRNIEGLQNYARSHNLGIRPHTKTHKSLKLAQWQLEAGALGLTVAKVGEAQVMATATDDLLVAYPVVDPGACQRAAELARTLTVRLAVDSTYALGALSAAAQKSGSTLGILVDLDVGMGRTGLQTPQAALQLAQQVEIHPHLRLDGLFCYPGHIWNPMEEQAKPLALVGALLDEALALFGAHGLNTAIVSGGSTPTARQSHLLPQLTEIRPGTSIFNDRNTVAGGFCSWEDCAATLVCTVVSNAVPGQVVLDAGTKTLTSDRCIPDLESGHGYILEYPAARITRLSEEHGQVDVTACERAPKIGERLTVVPNHICPCINLQDRVYMASADSSLHTLPVDARGRIS